jgi:hypothetical protein
MKKYISKIVMMMAIALSFSAMADAQISVRIRPTFVARERPQRPSPRHVWVGGEWKYGNGNYQYNDGYWSEPQRGQRRYSEGHWRHGRRGWTWVPGRWDR